MAQATRKVFYTEMPPAVQKDVARIQELDVQLHRRKEDLMPIVHAINQFNTTYGVVLCHHNGKRGDLLGYYYEQ